MIINDLKNIKNESIRKAYGDALTKYAAINEKVIVLEADVSSSTFTDIFAKKFPDRFFNFGIAEEGMMDIAAGMALEGMIPFVNSFASIICYRTLEQIRTTVAYNNANVKIVASYAGVSSYKDGPTHHSVFDIAVMRAMPNMVVLVAADSMEASKMVKAAAEYNGPVYLRLSRADMPAIFTRNHEVIIGKGVQIKDGIDLTLVCSGTLLYITLQAAEKLLSEGIKAGVIEIHTLKPFDSEIIIQAAELTGAIVTVEEHNIIGGLFGAVAECIVQNKLVPMEPVGINDLYARTSMDVDSLLDYLDLTTNHIIRASKNVIKKKKG